MRAPRRARRAWCAVALATLAVAATSSALPAQPARAAGGGAARPPDAPLDVPGLVDRPATLPDGSRRVVGLVQLVRDTTMTPLPGAWVTLHRVGSDAAAPLDSVRTDASGGYAFRYRPTGVADALYFASSSHGGIAYFTSPLREADVRGDPAEITVFDTTSRAVPVTVRGRHLIVSAPTPAGARSVIEVFELSNDTSVTAVAPAGDGRGTWSVALPPGAREFAVRPGELPADGMVAVGDRAVLRVPLAPGLKQVAFSYQLADAGAPLQLAIERPVTVLEVLLEDPRGAATGAGLVAAEAVVLEGRTFRRFLAQDVAAASAVDVSLPGTPRRWEAVALPILLVTLGGAMVVLLLRAVRRPLPAAGAAPAVAAGPVRAPTPRVAAPVTERERLLGDLAALDDDFAARTAPTADERADYERERAALKARLASRLAASEGPG